MGRGNGLDARVPGGGVGGQGHSLVRLVCPRGLHRHAGGRCTLRLQPEFGAPHGLKLCGRSMPGCCSQEERTGPESRVCAKLAAALRVTCQPPEHYRTACQAFRAALDVQSPGGGSPGQSS